MRVIQRTQSTMGMGLILTRRFRKTSTRLLHPLDWHLEKIIRRGQGCPTNMAFNLMEIHRWKNVCSILEKGAVCCKNG